MFELSMFCRPINPHAHSHSGQFSEQFCQHTTLVYEHYNDFVMSADTSVQLDANNMMAGQALIFELTLVRIDPVEN